MANDKADNKPDGNMEKKTHDHGNGHAAIQKLHHRSFLDTVNLGYLGAGVGTLLTAWGSVNGHFYKNKIEGGRNSDDVDIRDDKLSILAESEEQTRASGNWGWRNSLKHIRETNQYERDLQNAIDRTEFGPKGAKPFLLGTFQRFADIKPHQRTRVLVMVGTVASIALGAIYSFTRERRLAERLERQEKENADLQRKM